MGLTDSCRTFCTTKVHSSQAHMEVSRVDHMISHKISHNSFLKLKSYLFNHREIKLEINNKNFGNHTNKGNKIIYS
jgi:hypothetical protein